MSHAMMSPMHITFSAGKTMNASPSVWPAPNQYRSIRSAPRPIVSLSWKVVPTCVWLGIALIRAALLACATICTEPRAVLISLFEPMWSGCEWVLMIIVTGLSVSDLTTSRIAWPLLASLVSTSVTPSLRMNTVVFPPAPKIL
jgi:hypothetical protein